MRCKGLLRKKEATPAFKLVQYATMGRQDARQCSSTAARHIAHTSIRQHAIAVARLQRRGSEAMQPDSKRIALPSATRIRQLASGVVVGAAALGAEIGHAGTGAFGQPRARPSRLQGDEYVAASRSGARARCSFTCMGRGRRAKIWSRSVRRSAMDPGGGGFCSRGLCQCISAKRATRPPLVPRFYLLRSLTPPSAIRTLRYT